MIKFLLTLSLFALGQCLDVEILFKVTTTLEQVMINTKSTERKMAKISDAALESTGTRCFTVCQSGTTTCYSCGTDGLNEQISKEFIIRQIGSTDFPASEFAAIATKTETQLTAVYGEGNVQPTRVNIAPSAERTATLITVDSTVTEIREKLNEINAITENSLGIVSTCSTICNTGNIQTGKCYSCHNTAIAAPQEKGVYTMTMFGRTLYKETDLQRIQQEMYTPLRSVFGTDDVTDVRITLNPSTTNSLVVHVTVDGSLALIKTLMSDIELSTNNALNSANSKCSAICEVPIGGCYSCDTTLNNNGLQKMTIVLTTSSSQEKSKHSTIEVELSTKLRAKFTKIHSVALSEATKTTQLSLRIIINSSLKELNEKSSDVIALANQHLGNTNTRCSLICDFTASNRAACFPCSTSSALTTTRRYVYIMTAETDHDPSQLGGVGNGLITALIAPFGEGNLVRADLLAVPPRTPTTLAPELPFTVRYIITMELDKLIQSTDQIIQTTQQQLNGTTGSCSSVCEVVRDGVYGDCFPCGRIGRTVQQRASVLAAKKWELSMFVTADRNKQISAKDHYNSVNGLISSLGGELLVVDFSGALLLRTLLLIDARDSVFPVPTPTPTTLETEVSDDSLSGGAIAGIVIGSLVGVVLIIVIIYCFACKKEDNVEQEMAVVKGPDTL